MEPSIYDIIASVVNVNHYDAITLGQLINTLSTVNPNLIVEDGFTNPDSWRGVYAFLAFTPAKNVTAGSMLQHAKSAVGGIYDGYKGDKFTMNRKTPCFIAGYGQCSDNDAITPQRTTNMLGTFVISDYPSSLPLRPPLVVAWTNTGIKIEDKQWNAFQTYVCELESIVAKTENP